MAKVTVLTPAPSADPTALKGSAELCSAPSLDVLLKAAAGGGANVSVRPWFWQEGEWWPLGYDAVATTAAPVTADKTKLTGKANGRYQFQRGPLWVVLVLESGSLADIEAAYLNSVERE